jgi:hypothetical protein
MINVIVKEPNKGARVEKIDGDLKSMQAIVGGLIQLVPGDVIGLPPGVDMYVNDEGKLQELAPNLALRSQGKVFDIVVGTAFYAMHDDEGAAVDLPQELHPFVMEHCRSNAL